MGRNRGSAILRHTHSGNIFFSFSICLIQHILHIFNRRRLLCRTAFIASPAVGGRYISHPQNRFSIFVPDGLGIGDKAALGTVWGNMELVGILVKGEKGVGIQIAELQFRFGAKQLVAGIRHIAQGNQCAPGVVIVGIDSAVILQRFPQGSRQHHFLVSIFL